VRDLEIGQPINSESVQKLQMALHAKAKAEAGYRFYALYDKIYREDILAHAYAQCRSNKGAPGVDGQDFADIEAYGVERWLGELALALREETTDRTRSEECSYRKPTANSGRWVSRPCGIGSA
jgi:RNA-directed DNA polymerase